MNAYYLYNKTTNKALRMLLVVFCHFNQGNRSSPNSAIQPSSQSIICWYVYSLCQSIDHVLQLNVFHADCGKAQADKGDSQC